MYLLVEFSRNHTAIYPERKTSPGPNASNIVIFLVLRYDCVDALFRQFISALPTFISVIESHDPKTESGARNVGSTPAQEYSGVNFEKEHLLVFLQTVGLLLD